jgi:SAM-dependent methyltransferase
MKLNLGCGSQVPDVWINVDYAIGARLAKIAFFRALNKNLKVFNLDWNNRIFIHDLRKKFPWKNNSAAVVYTSHTLEHFTREEGRKFLAECHRILRKDGIIRVVVPDLNYIVKEYSDGRLHADEFIEKLGVLYMNSSNTIKNCLSLFIQFPHKCMYDAPTLLSMLGEIGFHAGCKKPFDSEIEDIRRVEDEGRTQNAVIVEGRKL